MEFHPNGQIALVAGLDKTLRLFEIDGKQNPHLQSIFFEDMPIFSAHFTADGKEIILSGNKPFFYVYDISANRVDKVRRIVGAEKQRKLKRMLVSPDNAYIIFIGDNGQILVLSNKSKTLLSTLKMPVRVITTACFTPDGNQLYVASSASTTFGAVLIRLVAHISPGSGEIYCWDMATFTLQRKYKDEGAMKVTCMAISSDGQYQALGQDSGVVNIYRMDDPSFLR